MHRKSMRAQQHIHTSHVYKLSINRKRCLINIFNRRSEWNFNNYRHRLCVKFLSWIQLTFDILMWHVEQMSLRSVVPPVFVAACVCLWLFSDCFWSATERKKKYTHEKPVQLWDCSACKSIVSTCHFHHFKRLSTGGSREEVEEKKSIQFVEP